MGGAAVWTQPIATAIHFNRAGFRTANETGDLAFACYGELHTGTDLLLRNDPLDSIWRTTERTLDFVRKARYRDIADLIVCQQRLIATLQGRTGHLSTFSDEHFDESTFEAELTDDRTSALICGYWIIKLQARFLAGDFVAALAASQQAKARIWALVGQFQVLDFFYFTALTAATLYEGASAEQRAGWRDLLAEHREQLREWDESYAPTFADKHALVSAEIARIEGHDAEAMRLYEQASRLARENGFLGYEAIAHERAAAFYRSRGVATVADDCIRAARACFARWGAHAKVRRLDMSLPPPREGIPLRAGSSVDNAAQLDLLSVVKASQAISGLIVLDELIDTLMHIVLESAGAQTCHLLLVRNDVLLHAAEAHVTRQAIDVQRHLDRVVAMPTSPEGDTHDTQLMNSAFSPSAPPPSIINYVQRSHEWVLLTDATQSNPFAADNYFSRRQPKSVLCLPIMRRSSLSGLLYLENNLATHAFTPEHMTVLELLASQAAVSLENALLYADLQQENCERKLAEEELREREVRIRRIVESNIIGLFFWNTAGMATDANDEFLRIIGYSRDDLVSGRIGWAEMTPPEYHAADVRVLDTLRRGGNCQPYEKEYIRKDGQRIPVLLGAALLDGSQENGVAFVLDLTAQKKAEAELTLRRADAQQAEERLQALRAELAHATRVTTLGELSASIAHEVGQPLCAIVISGEACLRWLDRRTPRLERARIGVERMIEASTRANEIVRRVRSLTKGAAPQKTQLALNEVINDVVALVQREVSHHRVSLRLSLAAGLPTLLGDRIQLQQVLINLVMNGIQAMSDSGDSPRELTIESRGDNEGHVVVAVRDSGPGIDPAIANQLFDAFFTTKSNGMGMGLSICRSIIEEHGGQLWASSNEGPGATFQFILPAQ
jgi:PAS domain S-box-containing protein